MKPSDVHALVPGLYRLTFIQAMGGKTALAVVGAYAGVQKLSRWWIVSHVRIDARKNYATSHLVNNDWEVVAKAELIRSEDGDEYIRDAKALTMTEMHKIEPDVAEVIRDLFLSGQDVDAIAVMARELGMSMPQPYTAAMFRVVQAAVQVIEHLDGGRLANWRDRTEATKEVRDAVKEWRAFSKSATVEES